MMLLPLAFTVILALYGWSLIKRLAKGREAFDLYSSVISTLEQIEDDATKAWAGNLKSLPEFTEIKLLAKVADIEQRLGLLDKHYRSNKKPAKDTAQRMLKLRQLLTKESDAESESIFLAEEFRIIEIHRLANTMISELLEENYDYINKLRQWSLF